jgi:hypothetical protein
LGCNFFFSSLGILKFRELYRLLWIEVGQTLLHQGLNYIQLQYRSLTEPSVVGYRGSNLK